MKIFDRSYWLVFGVLFFTFLIQGCVKQPVQLSGPGTEKWNLNAIVNFGDDTAEINNQKMYLIPSPTEKGVFSVVAKIEWEFSPPFGRFGAYSVRGEWNGEIKNGIFAGTTSKIVQTEEGPGNVTGDVKGTFSGDRASGTFTETSDGGITRGQWTAEKIK